MIYMTIKSDEDRIRKTRAEILVALRDLMYDDAAKMEDLGNSACNYCDGDREVGDGHSAFCSFADAVELLFKHRAETINGIIEETKALRTALLNLASDDYLLMKGPGPCTHCHSIHHTETCTLHNAVKVLENTRNIV